MKKPTKVCKHKVYTVDGVAKLHRTESRKTHLIEQNRSMLFSFVRRATYPCPLHRMGLKRVFSSWQAPRIKIEHNRLGRQALVVQACLFCLPGIACGTVLWTHMSSWDPSTST